MDKALLARLLRKRFDESTLRCNVPLERYTTFHIGGPADYLIEAASVDDIADASAAARSAGVPVWVIGCGSNVLVADDGLHGIVIHLGERFADIEIEGSTIRAQAGATNDSVARAAQKAGLAGYEFASGIPGSIGGAAYMNAGAYDGQFSDVCVQVTCLDAEGVVVTLDAGQARWGYRRSAMMEQGLIVLEATLALHPGNPVAIQQRIDDLAARRASKQPLELGSAGSTFKRPHGYFAGQLIEEAGMRGHAVGDAKVSQKHCGFVVNTGHATAADVRAVIADVQQAVLETSGVSLVPEVRMWGFDPHPIGGRG